MKLNFWISLATISIICLGADCDNIIAFIIWHLAWLIVFLFSAIKIDSLIDK